MNQLDLIAPVHLARARGHAAAQRAADRTERVVDPEWCAKACDALRKFAAAQGDGVLFTLELARGVIELQRSVPEPVDRRAWGQATLMAVRREYIERTKTYHPAVSSNGTAKVCYRAGAKARQA